MGKGAQALPGQKKLQNTRCPQVKLVCTWWLLMETPRIKGQVEEMRRADDGEEEKTLTRDPGRRKDPLVFSTGAILDTGRRAKGMRSQQSAMFALSRRGRFREEFSSYGQTPILQRT